MKKLYFFKKMNSAFFGALFLTGFITVTPGESLSAEPQLTADQIIRKNESLPEPSSSQMSMALVIERSGNQEILEFESYMKKFAAGTRMRIRFTKPVQIEFLSHSSPGRSADQWIKLSGPVVRRIAAGEKSSSFVNSHFYYTDMEDKDINDYNYSLLGKEAAGGESCWKIKSEKKAKDDVYTHTELFISEKDFTLKQVNFYESGRLSKTLTVERTDWIQGIPVVRKMVMSRADGSGRSIIYTKKIQLNASLNDSLFSPAGMQ